MYLTISQWKLLLLRSDVIYVPSIYFAKYFLLNYIEALHGSVRLGEQSYQ